MPGSVKVRVTVLPVRRRLESSKARSVVPAYGASLGPVVAGAKGDPGFHRPRAIGVGIHRSTSRVSKAVADANA